MANSQLAKAAIKSCLGANVVPFLWGTHGIGKSSIVQQIVEDKWGECITSKEHDLDPSKKINFIDLRLGNLEVGDLIGMPLVDKMNETGEMIFAIPQYWPKENDGRTADEGIIFLDELNRAQQVVLQACFSLVLDRRINNYHIPDGWKVVAAGNPSDGDYIVNELDDALFSRFAHIEFEPQKGDFLNYAKQTGKISQRVASFVEEKGGAMLFGEVAANKKDTGETVKVGPNPRAYEMLSNVMEVIGEPTGKFDGQSSEVVLRTVAQGLIGQQASSALIAYLRESDRPLKGVDILDSYDKFRKKVKGWTSKAQISMSLINATADNTVAEIIDRIKEDPDYYDKNVQTMSIQDAKKQKLDHFVAQEGKKKVAVVGQEVVNFANFLMDVPIEVTVAVVKRDLFNREFESGKTSQEIRKGISKLLRHLLSYPELHKKTVEAADVPEKMSKD